MSSVRDRITGEQYLERQRQDAEKARAEAAAKANQPAAPVVLGSRNGMTAGNAPTMSVRERAEMRAAQEPETLTPPRRAAATTGTLINAAPMSVRERQERADALARVNAETPTNSRSADADAWYEYEMNRRREDEQREREREREQAERIARQEAREKAEGERAVWLIGVNQMFDTLRATDAERARVLALLTVKVGMDPDKVGGILLTLRDAMRSKPDWAANL